MGIFAGNQGEGMSLFDKMTKPQRWRVPAALGAVYLIWGSTYLGIRFAIETMPPFLMGGTRFLIAGAILYVIARLGGARAPKRRHWLSAAIIGALLLLGGNGGLTWAEQIVPSGMASLFISTVPLWMVLLDWLVLKGPRPSSGVAAGLGLGLVGVSVLVGPDSARGQFATILPGVLAVLLAAFLWAIGSLYSRRANLPASPLLATGMEMVMGGLWLSTAALVLGEFGQFRPELISSRSFLAIVYLTLFGSLVGFTCYIWLLRVAAPSLVSTYAFVNPVVAVFLGWALAGESLTARTLVAALFIITAVAIITLFEMRPGTAQDSSGLLMEQDKPVLGDGD
jgi:drug/metabolite transporter (DMT)-like permease